MTAKGKSTTEEDTAVHTLADELQALGVGGILPRMAKRGQLLKLRCEMPQCYCPRGRAHFERKEHSPPDRIPNWIPTPDHYPILKAHGGKLSPDNVRLAHRLCNLRDHGWRMKINSMLKRGMALEKIAESLNRQKIPPANGKPSQWSAKSVRKAFVS